MPNVFFFKKLLTAANVFCYLLGMAQTHEINVTRIKREMCRRFWNQARLADAAGLSEGSVSIALRGGRCTATLAGKLAAALDLTSSQIFLRREAS